MVGYFMNAAIDQQCEIYITKNNLEKEVQKTIDDLYQKKGTKRPSYQGKIPETNNGLGLMLLGITGDMVLPADVYAKLKRNSVASKRDNSG